MNLAYLCERLIVSMLLHASRRKLSALTFQHIPYGLREKFKGRLTDVLWHNPHFPFFPEKERTLEAICLNKIAVSFKLHVINWAKFWLHPLQNEYFINRIINRFRIEMVWTEVYGKGSIKYSSPRLNIWMV
jgi:hypothetical protein